MREPTHRMTTVSTSPARETTRGRAWTSLVLGVLIFLVPLATASNTSEYSQFMFSNYIVGAVVAILGAICIWAAKNSMVTLAWLEGINTLLGVWTIVSPFTLATETNAMYANIVLGAILVIVAGWDAYVGMTNSGGRMTTRGRPT
jgi:hypothetical protein